MPSFESRSPLNNPRAASWSGWTAAWAMAAVLALAGSALGDVTVELHEGVPDKRNWEFSPPPAVDRYSEPAMGFVAVPSRFGNRGILADRALPLLLTAGCDVTLPAGEYRFLLRSRNGARLRMDDRVIAQTKFIDSRGDGHEAVPEKPVVVQKGLREPALAHHEALITLSLDGKPHRFRFEAFVGGQKLRPEVGELMVAVAKAGEPFRLLAPTPSVVVSDEAWAEYAAEQRARIQAVNEKSRLAARAADDEVWKARHAQARAQIQKMPPVSIPHGPAKNPIDRLIDATLAEKKIPPTGAIDDLAFLRRLMLDTTGVLPTRAEIDRFLADPPGDRRRTAVDRALASPAWADHWVSYWQDVLAENPGILKPNLNNTGPFRWWLHQALSDNLSMDRFATELIRMEGSKMYGGPAGFGVATENDAPLAAKAHILAKAFLGIDLQCARCHDAPFQPYTQRQLFELAALLGRGPQTLPKTSTVPVAEGMRKPRVTIALKPGEKIAPKWSVPDLGSEKWGESAKDHREKFAAILTAAENSRFAEVVANRLWKRWLGRGLVEPVDDWGDSTPSHPELLKYLGRELAANQFDLKYLARLILNSNLYQRQVVTADAAGSDRSFAGPYRRRLTAEQLVDSLFHAAGKKFDSEALTMDPEGRRPPTEMLNLGVPTRAWQFTSLSNERDRPALALPMAQGIVDLLTAYGWRDSRQNPLTVRDETPTALQPLVLAHGSAAHRITRLDDEHRLTDLCCQERPLAALIDDLFLTLLTRKPSESERVLFSDLLGPGYSERLVPGAVVKKRRIGGPSSTVSWSNHLNPEATKIKLELERRAREGDPPSARLQPNWRERMEDAIWALINTPEFVFAP